MRPHSSLGGRIPYEFMLTFKRLAISLLSLESDIDPLASSGGSGQGSSCSRHF